mgnify:CR=1 FL=1
MSSQEAEAPARQRQGLQEKTSPVAAKPAHSARIVTHSGRQSNVSLRRTIFAGLALALFIVTLAAAGWAAHNAPTWLALVVGLGAIAVVLWRLGEDGES